MHIWVTGDTAGLAALVSHDAVYEDVPRKTRYKGVAGFAERIQDFHSWASDLKLVYRTYKPELTSHRFSAGEWAFTGVQKGSISARLSFISSEPFDLRGVTVVNVKDGKIVHASEYYDLLGLMLQFRARVEFPDGSVVERDKPAWDNP